MESNKKRFVMEFGARHVEKFRKLIEIYDYHDIGFENDIIEHYLLIDGSTVCTCHVNCSVEVFRDLLAYLSRNGVEAW